MQIPLQVTFKNMDSSPAVEARIREKASMLERFSSHVTGCRVVVEAPHRRGRKGKLYQVTVHATMPRGIDIVASHRHRNDHRHEDIYVAIHDAFDAAARQIEDAARKLRGDVKQHDTPLHGRIFRMFPDYGFITLPDGEEVYFHKNSVVGTDFESLNPDDEVRVVVVEGESEHGAQATTVQPIGKHHIVP